mgnify:CR=1 FL=1
MHFPLLLSGSGKVEDEVLQALLQRCQKNDKSAQERVYKLFFMSMLSSIRHKIKDEHDAVSIVNDGFLKAFLHIHTYSLEKGSFDAWLKTIVINTAIDHVKKKKRSISFTSLNDDLPLSDNSHLKVSKPEHLQRLIGHLPPLARIVLSLSVEGYSHREISHLLRISEMASRWHLSEAKRKLKSTLRKGNFYKT